MQYRVLRVERPAFGSVRSNRREGGEPCLQDWPE